MKILIIGDLHGRKPRIHFKDFDAILAPGDFCSDYTKKYRYQLLKQNYRSESGHKIGWYDIVGIEKAKKMIEESASTGRKILKYLNSLGVPVYVVPGNWDWVRYKRFLYRNAPDNKDRYKVLVKNLSNIMDVHYKIASLDSYQIIGYGTSFGPEYPQHKKDLVRFRTELKKRRKNYENILKKMSCLFERSKKPIIFLSHNVPFDTSLDRIMNKRSPRNGWHYGSLVTRKIIEKYQPLLCIGGHIHEHFGKCKIGRTICINSGFGSSVNVLVELNDNKITKIDFFPKNK